MDIALRKPMALPEFLAWEAAQPAKWEFNGFEPVAMVGVRLAHSAIQVTCSPRCGAACGASRAGRTAAT